MYIFKFIITFIFIFIFTITHAHTHTHTHKCSGVVRRFSEAMLAVADMGAGDLCCSWLQEVGRLLIGFRA